jgi:hypothetical protein
MLPAAHVAPAPVLTRSCMRGPLRQRQRCWPKAESMSEMPHPSVGHARKLCCQVRHLRGGTGRRSGSQVRHGWRSAVAEESGGAWVAQNPGGSLPGSWIQVSRSITAGAGRAGQSLIGVSPLHHCRRGMGRGSTVQQTPSRGSARRPENTRRRSMTSRSTRAVARSRKPRPMRPRRAARSGRMRGG